MLAQEVTLVSRLAKFGELLERCACTNSRGEAESYEASVSFLLDRLHRARASGNRLYLIGNGGSAGVASHAATDFFNAAKIMAHTLNDVAQLTCLANDHGYEHAYARMLAQATRPGDLLIAISSSGNSMNIRNAAACVRELGAEVITLTGFADDNPLRGMGDLNFWLDSRDYGLVEIGHQFILHNISDRFLEA